MIKLVLTDAQTVTNGDIDLSVLEAFVRKPEAEAAGAPHCFRAFDAMEVYPLSDREETKARIADAGAVLINKTVLDAEVLACAPHLRYIGVFATGYNMIDLDYCKAHGITVCNAGSYSTEAVAQTVFAFLLNHYSRVSEYNRFVADGGWIASPSFSPFVFPTMELAGKSIGIIGCGSIGQKVAKIADAFSMRVRMTTLHPERHRDCPYPLVDFDTLLASSDIITCHCPLTKETERLFDREAFAKCRKGAYFINTSRGGVVEEEALRDALASGQLSGAGIDVLTREPMEKDCVLYGAKNLTFTPHVAWAPLETRERLLDIVTDNLKNYLAGMPTHVIV